MHPLPILAVLVLCLAAGDSARALETPAGFTTLFNGTDLSGWWGAGTGDPATWMALPAEALAQKKQASLADIRAHWRVENGELVNDGNGLYLTSGQLFGDFELRVDYRTVAQADSGIYLRGIPQVQIWDTTAAGGKWKLGADKGSGGLWNNPPGSPGRDPLVLADKPFGEWNQLRIVMVGERVTVWLNGRLVVDHARLHNHFAKGRAVPRYGPIQLQTHGGEIRWRNLVIRPIADDEAVAILRAGGPDKPAVVDDGFTAVFNGKDFTGWSGPIANYEVVDGAIVCRPHQGGTIYTTDTYADFVARIEFRLPPAGNNGLAIRYPGAGEAAYVGMCELQILDSEHPSYARLDPRQHHGSVYGMIAAQRGHLRETGQWNFQEVTVQGSTIRVELNGTLILAGDVAKVTSFHQDKAHPGKDRRDGHFGLAGHRDPVAFRSLRIKRL